MDIRQLEAFVYTAKYQSFSLAAQKLYLSQPTVSSHICNLEKELHTQLLQRTTKALSMTPAGRRLYSYAAEILDLRHKAVLELTSQQEATLHIGVSSVPSLHLLPELLAAYHAQVPEVRFRTSCSDSLDVIRRVSEGGCDIGLAGTKTAAPGCGFLPVTSDELVLAAPNISGNISSRRSRCGRCCASRFCCARTTRAPSRKRCTFCGTWGCRSTS